MSDPNQKLLQQNCLSYTIDNQESCPKNRTENPQNESELLIVNPFRSSSLFQPNISDISDKSNDRIVNIEDQQNQNRQNTYEKKCEKEQVPLIQQHQIIRFFQNKRSKIQYSILLFLLTILILLLCRGELHNLRQNNLDIPNQNGITTRKLTKEGQAAIVDYEKEILKKLKGQRITLENSNQTDNDIVLEQIKTDMLNLKQRRVKGHLFEVYFLILLGKLEKLHELDIVHGNIKPQNIVISYDNEPFFINFESSVFLSDYSHNLKNYFTPQQNLNQNAILDDENEQMKFISKKFKNEEDIKASDRTQLALTFLYLFCEEEYEFQLFENNDYKSLMDYFLETKTNDENKQIILQIINQILHETDQSIKLNEIQKDKKSFTIDFTSLQTDIKNINNVFYQKDTNTYYAQRIDKFSIKLLSLLDQLGVNLKIFPSCIQIIPQSQDNKEYQCILEKYKQIKEYFNQFYNMDYLQYQHHKKWFQCYLFNLSQYIQSEYFDKNQVVQLPYIKNSREFHLILKQALINDFEISLLLDLNELQEIIQVMAQRYPDFYIQSIQSNGVFLRCQVIKTNKKKDQITNIELTLNSNSAIEDWIKIFTDIIKEDPKTYYELNINSSLFSNFLNKLNSQQDPIQILQKELNDVNGVINSFYQEYRPYMKRLRQNINVQSLWNSFDKKNYYQCLDVRENNTQKTSNNNENLEIKQQHCNNFYYVSYSSFEFKALEVFFINSLQYLRQEDHSLKMIFYQYFFEQKYIWDELREYIKSDQPNKIRKIILIDCQFSQEVDQIIQDIKQNNKKVKIGYFDQYDQQLSNQNSSEEFHIQEKYKLNVEYSYQQSEQLELEIQFFKKLSENNQKNTNILQTEKTLLNNDSIDKIEISENEKQIQKQQLKEKTEKQQQSIKSIQNFIELQWIYKSEFFKNIQIPNSVSHKIESIKNINKIIYIFQREDIAILIEDLKNKVHLKQIIIEMDQYQLDFLGQNTGIDLDGIQIDELISLEELVDILIYNYQSFFNMRLITQNQSYQTRTFKESFYFSRNLNQTTTINNDLLNDTLHSFIGFDDFFVHVVDVFYKDESQIYKDESYISGYKSLNEYQLDDINKFLSDNRLQNKRIFQQVIQEAVQKEKYIELFNLDSIDFTNESFKILFQGLENKYSQIRFYSVGFQLSIRLSDLVYNIYEIIKVYEQKQTIIFNFIKTGSLTCFQLKQFIRKIIIDSNNFEEFEFEIYSYYQDVIELIENQFKNYLQPQIHNNNNNQSKFIFQISLSQDKSDFLSIWQKEKQRKIKINLRDLDKNKIKDFIRMLDTKLQVA